MSISFNRNRTQVKYEAMLGISSFEELPNRKDDFKSHVLSILEANDLKELVVLDACDYLHNGMISMAEGFDNMFKRHYSWATVKLYYSIFYYLRASMAINGVAILQNGNMYRLRLNKDESPIGSNNRRYASTHSGTITHYKEVFGQSDRLISNSIDNCDVYQWMEDVRNIVNYREVKFLDPDCLSIWDVYDEAMNNNTINFLFDSLINDDLCTYCFQEEYAVVAIALKRFQLTLKDFFDRGYYSVSHNERFDYIMSIIPNQLDLKGLFSKSGL